MDKIRAILSRYAPNSEAASINYFVYYQQATFINGIQVTYI